MLHSVMVHCSSPGAAQKGGAAWHWTGGQQSAPVQAPGNRQFAAGTGIWPSGQVPSPAGSVHAGAGPPQQGVTQIWPPGQVSVPHAKTPPVLPPELELELVGAPLELAPGSVAPVVLVLGELVLPVVSSPFSPQARRHAKESTRGERRGESMPRA